MQKFLLICCGLLLSLSLLAGCAMTTPGLGEESGNATLPSGSTLLDSEDGECNGTVQVAEGMIEDEGEGLDGAFLVEPGENATFKLEDDDDIEWACVGGDDSDVESISCPSGATHVRITRAESGGELLIECFG